MQELNKNYKPDSHRQALAEEFTKLCEETQALQGDNPLTEEEIAAYWRSELELLLQILIHKSLLRKMPFLGKLKNCINRKRIKSRGLYYDKIF